MTGHLTWTHICELLIIEDKDKRSFFEKESTSWSIRELKRQIDSSLYERLLLSQGKANKEKVLELAQKGQELNTAEDVLKNPYVFEFLGIPESKPTSTKWCKIIGPEATRTHDPKTAIYHFVPAQHLYIPK